MYYFAYASNLNLEHMRRLLGWHFSVLGPATLADFYFAPDKRGYASIFPKAGSRVWGVLYELEPGSLDILDEFEGYPEVFGRQEVLAVDSAGKSYKAWVYLEPEDQLASGKIKEDYLRRTIAGAVQNHLPEEWVKFLENFK